MSIEFIGFISNNNSSETIVREGPVLDPTHIETVAVFSTKARIWF